MATELEATPETPKSDAPAQEKKPSKPPKPPLTIYSWMLILSLLFLLIGSAALLVELNRYGFEIRPGFQLIKF